MRKMLDTLYRAALGGACIAMVVIAGLVFFQVMGRVIDRVAVALGAERIGLSVPSLAEIGGYLFGATAFLALAATLRSGGHVRVTLALRAFGPRGDRVASFLVLAVALGLILFIGWSIFQQTLTTYERGSVSYGIIAIPLWIPQAAMTAGLLVFAIALIDELASVLRGDVPAFRAAELSRESAEEGGR